MYIMVDSVSRQFKAWLHWAIYDGYRLYAASFAGIPSAVTAVSASIIEGRRVVLLGEDIRKELFFNKGGGRRIEKLINGLSHAVVLSKDAVYEDASQSYVILAPDGDIKKAVGRYLAAKFALPQEWEEEYFDLLPFYCISRLGVIIDDTVDTWKNLQAVHFSLSEESLLGYIEEAIKKGQLTIPTGQLNASFDSSWDLKTYLQKNIHVLTRQVNAIRPRYVPGEDFLDPEVAKMNRIPFPAQAHAIQGLVKILEKEKSAFACGDMGTGKTMVALGVCHLMAQRKKNMSVLVVAPGITIPKWHHQEIEKTLPQAKIRVLESSEDAGRLLREARAGYEPQGLELVLVGTDRAKLGPEPWCAALWKRIRGTKSYAWHCPDCFHVLPDPGEKEEFIPAGWDVLACGEPPEKSIYKTAQGLPVGFSVKWKVKTPLKKCPHCGTKLWRPALKSRGEARNKPRWYICRILRKMPRKFDLLIQDEVHQVKAQDSGRGDSFAQLVKASKKTLALTGTLVNGLSTSIKEILWRTEPHALLAEGFNHKTGMVQWAGRYGVLERVFRSEERDDGVITRRRRTETQPKEKPGIAPQLTAHFLLHKVAFMELGDLGLPLVELKEIPVFVKMDKDHGKLYTDFHERLYQHCSNSMHSGAKNAFGKFIPATINYADRPDLGAQVIFRRIDPETGVEHVETIGAPALDENYRHAKERELVRIVQENISEDRGCFIYCSYTDRYEVHRRLQEVLEEAGIKATVLESNTAPEDRVEWLEKNQDAKVIIANMRLVEVGLDLLAWPTMIFYQLSYDVNTVRQASRRAWRIGQTRECRVYYLVYEKSQQTAQFQNVMAKRGHAMLVEGRLDRSELSKYARDSHSAMALDLADCLMDTEELRTRWTELAAKDIDARLKTVEEAKFYQALTEAQRKLAEETRRLCGITEEEAIQKAIASWEAAYMQVKPSKRGRKKIIPEGQLSLLDMLKAQVN